MVTITKNILAYNLGYQEAGLELLKATIDAPCSDTNEIERKRDELHSIIDDLFNRNKQMFQALLDDINP